jgi:hypothetical protein
MSDPEYDSECEEKNVECDVPCTTRLFEYTLCGKIRGKYVFMCRNTVFGFIPGTGLSQICNACGEATLMSDDERLLYDDERLKDAVNCLRFETLAQFLKSYTII